MSDDAPTVSRLPLAPPSRGRVDLLVIAAEHSGDEHAARMVRGLLARRPDLAIAALGGPALEGAGAQLLVDLTKSSAIGFAVIGKLSFFRALIADIVRWVGQYRPRAVCFVDSSGLNLPIAKRLFEGGISSRAGGPVKTLYYISPQIWASRAGRRFKMARHLDGLASIFPFERDSYADTPLPVEFVGHPFVADDYAPPVRHDPAGPILLLPGSRKQAVARIFPVLLAGFRAWGGTRDAVVLHPSDDILAVLRAANPPGNVRLQRTGESSAPIGGAAVLTSSGTMSMHCALAGIPGAIAYRTDPVTYFLGRMIVRVKFLGIANLLLGEAMYPEYIQNAATPPALAAELHACLENPARRAQTAEQAKRLRTLLAQPTGGSAVDWIERQLA